MIIVPRRFSVDISPSLTTYLSNYLFVIIIVQRLEIVFMDKLYACKHTVVVIKRISEIT